MINNFDHLIERCVARRRRTIIRFVGGTLFAFASISGYILWYSRPIAQTPIAHKKLFTAVESPYIAVLESNISTPPLSQEQPTQALISKSDLAEKNISSSTKISIESGNRTHALQLGSNKLYENAIALNKKVPEKYRSGIAIYFINGYYATRYIDITDERSIPALINDFKKSGFHNPLLIKYEATLVPVNTKNSSLGTDFSPTLSSPQAVPPQSKTSKSNLFDVNTQQIDPNIDPIVAYEKNPKYETALNIARNLYNKNNFSEAAVWAKKANQINREGEEAWLLYAKSYYAQGQKSEAIGVLELYMNYKDSKAATQLYNTWKTTH